MQVATSSGSFSHGLKQPQHRQLAQALCSSNGIRRSRSTPCLSALPHTAVGLSKLRDEATSQAPSRNGSEAGFVNQSQVNSSSQLRMTRAETCSTSSAAVHPASTQGVFASLSRVLLIGQPTTVFRNLAQRKWRAAGPISLLLFLFGLIVAILAAVRAALVRRVKGCKCCKGYGIVRCKLCNGDGKVDWRAKFSYQEVCPLCMTKRYVDCQECGGYYHKRMFTHSNLVKVPMTDSFQPAMSTDGNQ